MHFSGFCEKDYDYTVVPKECCDKTSVHTHFVVFKKSFLNSRETERVNGEWKPRG